MSLLSLYFGDKGVNIINAAGRAVLNNIEIPASSISSSDFEDKVPADIKIVALLHEAFRSNKLIPKEAVLCLSGKDLIVRTFEIPQLPREELENAINFEAKKYLPFRMEELVTTFQVRADNVKKNNLVVFMAIKKDTLGRYVSIASQLKFKISSLEYSALSLVRLLKINKGLESAVTAFIYIDSEGDESHFVVMENGFLLFSRDITLATLPTDALDAGPQDPVLILEKMKAEIKSSFDYYQRRFSGKPILKTVFYSDLVVREDLNVFLGELGQNAKFIDLARNLKSNGLINSGVIKSYSAVLSGSVNIGLKLDLLKVKSKKQSIESDFVMPDFSSVFKDVTVDFRVLFLALFLIAGMYVYGLVRIQPFKDGLSKTIAERPKVAQIDPESSYEDLGVKNAEFRKKAAIYEGIVKKQIYLTKQLNAIPRILPNSVWLTNFRFSYNDGVPILKLRGYVYLKNQQLEIDEVNKFLNELRSDLDFSAYFTKVVMDSVNQDRLGKQDVTAFDITCEGLRSGK